MVGATPCLDHPHLDGHGHILDIIRYVLHEHLECG